MTNTFVFFAKAKKGTQYQLIEKGTDFAIGAFLPVVLPV